MAVYVDRAEWPYGRMVMCHMIADSLDELHAMADRIGIQRRWFQGPPKHRTPHYDICKAKRRLAIQHGAIEVNDRRDMVRIKRRIRGETT